MLFYEPRYSVITLTCNRLEYLIQNITSIKKHSSHFYEHIIVNQGSTDGTKEWLDYVSNLKWYNYLKPIHLPGNKGIWYGYRKGDTERAWRNPHITQ